MKPPVKLTARDYGNIVGQLLLGLVGLGFWLFMVGGIICLAIWVFGRVVAWVN